VASLNKVFLIGNLTRDPEIRYTPSGSPITSFGLAVNRIYTDQSGEKKEDTCFVRIVVFGKQAETCSKYLSKGRLVMVQGRLQYRSWEFEGKKRNSLDVVGEVIQFLSSRSEKTENFADKKGQGPAEKEEEIFLDEDESAKDDNKSKPAEEDDEVPF